MEQGENSAENGDGLTKNGNEDHAQENTISTRQFAEQNKCDPQLMYEKVSSSLIPPILRT